MTKFKVALFTKLRISGKYEDKENKQEYDKYR